MTTVYCIEYSTARSVTHISFSCSEHEVPPLEEHDMERRIDTALKEQDTNGDGYIDYEEFLKHYRPDLHDKALHGAKTSH